jgi:alkylated DNA repair dioxygenase AlkB
VTVPHVPLHGAWAPTLFDAVPGGASPDDAFAAAERTDLGEGAWVEHQAGWLAGSAPLFDDLRHALAWRQPEVVMYGERVVQPRLSAWLAVDDLGRLHVRPASRAALRRTAELLGDRYRRRFATIGGNLYRHGDDSVAWHGDRVHRDHTDATIAIVSLGAARPFLLRPVGGGRSLRSDLGHGDLLVMGGTCQRTWQHAVPKVARPVGPRLSVTFRHGHAAPAPPRVAAGGDDRTPTRRNGGRGSRASVRHRRP